MDFILISTTTALHDDRGHIVVEARISQNWAAISIGVQVQQGPAVLPKLHCFRWLFGVDLRTSLATEVWPASEDGPVKCCQVDVGPVWYVSKVCLIAEQKVADLYGRKLPLRENSVRCPHQKLAALIHHVLTLGILLGKTWPPQRRGFTELPKNIRCKDEAFPHGRV